MKKFIVFMIFALFMAFALESKAADRDIGNDINYSVIDQQLPMQLNATTVSFDLQILPTLFSYRQAVMEVNVAESELYISVEPTDAWNNFTFSSINYSTSELYVRKFLSPLVSGNCTNLRDSNKFLDRHRRIC